MSFRVVSVLALALAAAPMPLLAENLTFTLANLSSADLTEFYASPVGVDSWEENILSGGALAAGNSGQVTISGAQGCNYDLRMVFADGDVLEDSSNICDAGTYTIQ